MTTKQSDVLTLIHTGWDSDYEMRSKSTLNGHSNQCIYNDNGDLTTYYPAAGSVDFGSIDNNKISHYDHDVATYIEARWWAGGMEDYYSVRPVWAE